MIEYTRAYKKQAQQEGDPKRTYGKELQSNKIEPRSKLQKGLASDNIITENSNVSDWWIVIEIERRLPIDLVRKLEESQLEHTLGIEDEAESSSWRN